MKPSSSLLDQIDTPDVLKTFSIKDMRTLAAEIRERIIEVVAVTGGHLASNLGVVELTLALHRVFDAPIDKLIWDTSHQIYPHKLITGRRKRFATLRQFKGVAGFSHPHESPYDHFFAGHAGNALSMALGVAKQRDLCGGSEYIIPILGDADLSCGLTLEALNNIPQNLQRFMVILNDNNMSISKPVGHISHILSQFLSNQALHKPASFFEQYALNYIGPIDGHDIATLIKTLEEVKDARGPLLVHVLTRKGEGMQEALENPTCYHGAKPFDRQTRRFHPNTRMTFPQIFGAHLLQMAESDPAVVAVTPAMAAGSCLDALMQRFPERCLDVGVAEGHCVTFCGGLAFGGKLKVVASIYSTFFQRAFDNLYHDVCLQELPVVFAIDRAGLAGGDGANANGIYDIGFLQAMPNMIIAQPRNGQLLKELLQSAFSWKKPTAIRYPNLATEDATHTLKHREVGKAELLVREKEVLLIGVGHMSFMALSVHRLLKEQGISSSVLDPIFIKPLDTTLLCELLIDHPFVVTIEEHSLAAGFGSILNHFLLSNGYNAQTLNIGVPEAFIEHGSHKELLQLLNITPEAISHAIQQRFFASTIEPPVPFCDIPAVLTFSDRLTVRQEASAGDEGSAPVIAEEPDVSDGRLAASRKLTAKAHKTQKAPSLQEQPC